VVLVGAYPKETVENSQPQSLSQVRGRHASMILPAEAYGRFDTAAVKMPDDNLVQCQ